MAITQFNCLVHALREYHAAGIHNAAHAPPETLRRAAMEQSRIWNQKVCPIVNKEWNRQVLQETQN